MIVMQCSQCRRELTQVGNFWVCPVHGQVDPSLPNPQVPTPSIAEQPLRIFLSYGRRDTKDLADRLSIDLSAAGYAVWQDTREITTGTDWQHEIIDGLRSAQLVIALMSPYSVRSSSRSADDTDSVCLSEIAYALYNPPPQPVVPVMARPCEPPLCIFHLDYTDMVAWQESEDQYQAGLRRLLDGIEAAVRGKKRYRKWYHQLNPWDFAPFLYEKRCGFIGRDWLFDEIDAWRASHRESTLLITGDPGTGKSALVAELVHRNPNGQIIAYHCCQADVRETLQPWRFVRSIAAMIASTVPEYAECLDDPNIQDALSMESCQRDAGSALDRGILTPLHAICAPKEGVRYILIDALDESLLLDQASTTLVRLLSTRLNRLPPWLRIVATTRKEPDVMTRLRGLRAMELDSQDPRNLEDIEAYIQAHLKTPNLAGRLVVSDVTPTAVSKILQEKCAGNFLYLRQALDGIETDQYRLDYLESLPPGLFGLYEEFFQRHFPDDEHFAEARKVLEVVTAAQEPLEECQLAKASGIESRRTLPRVLRMLRVYLPLRFDLEGTAHYSLYHKSIRDWLTADEQRGTAYSVDERDGHLQLAQMCWEEYQYGPSEMSQYAIAHLPTHLAEAKRWPELHQILTDLTFIETKCAAGMSYSLVEDYELLSAADARSPEADRTGRDFADFVRRESHLLARYPRLAFQLAANQPASCGPSDAAKSRWDHCSEIRPWFKWLNRSSLRAMCWMTFAAHTERVVSCVLSPDGRRILSGSWDCTLRLWDAQTGRQLVVFEGHSGPVNTCDFSANGEFVVSGSSDCTLNIWDPHTGMIDATLTGHRGSVLGCAISPASDRIASASADGTVRLWDAATAEPVAVFRGHTAAVNSCDFSPDGSRLASGSSDGTLKIWEVARAIELRTLDKHTLAVWCCSFSPSGELIASGSSDRTLRIWDSRTGTEKATLSQHQAGVCACEFSKQGDMVVSADYDQTIRLWNTNNLSSIATIVVQPFGLHDCTIMSDGGRVVSGSTDGTLRLWDVHDYGSSRGIGSFPAAVRACAVSPNGGSVLVGLADGSLRLHDIGKDCEIRKMSAHTDEVLACEFSPNGEWFVSGGADGKLRLWDIDANDPPTSISEHDGAIMTCAVSPDGKLVAVGVRSVVYMWDVVNGKSHVNLKHLERVTDCVFSPCGNFLVTSSTDHNLRVWEIDTGRELASLGGHNDWVWTCAFLPNGKRLVSGCKDGTLKMWEIDTAREIATWQAHNDWVRDCICSRDGTVIFSCASDKTVRAWETATQRELAVFVTTGRIYSLALGKGESTIAAGDSSGQLYLLRLEGIRC